MGLSRWSKWSRNNSQRRARAAQAQLGKIPRGEDRSGCKATIVAEIISCLTTRNGKKLKRNSILPRETESLAPFDHMDGHRDGTLGPLDDRKGGNRGML